MKHLIGSSYFFSCYDDFTPHDVDHIEIIETNEFNHKRQITGRGSCLFQLKKKDSFKEYLDWDITESVGMCLGKWLIPEFCEEVGFTVDDLPQLLPFIDLLDPKHRYEAIIYNAYVENGSLTLTDKQRLEAYKSYQESRNLSTVE